MYTAGVAEARAGQLCCVRPYHRTCLSIVCARQMRGGRMRVARLEARQLLSGSRHLQALDAAYPGPAYSVGSGCYHRPLNREQSMTASRNNTQAMSSCLGPK